VLTQSSAVIDASTLINLAAAEVFAEMLQAIADRCFLCRVVKTECLFIRSADGSQLDSVEPVRWIEAGIMFECELAPDEEERFVTYAAAIDDGEAMCLAVAEARAYVLVTDDRKAKHLAKEIGVRTLSTAAIVREWAHAKSDEAIVGVINSIEKRARFRPPDDDSDYEWWMAQHGQAR
jgi:predicted nucleic acid-binding protein